jgi:hypothetical protein
MNKITNIAFVRPAQSQFLLGVASRKVGGHVGGQLAPTSSYRGAMHATTAPWEEFHTTESSSTVHKHSRREVNRGYIVLQPVPYAVRLRGPLSEIRLATFPQWSQDILANRPPKHNIIPTWHTRASRERTLDTPGHHVEIKRQHQGCTAIEPALGQVKSNPKRVASRHINFSRI